MRKFIIFLLFFVLVLLTFFSCGSAEVTVEEIREIFEQDVTLNMEISYRGLEVGAVLTLPKVGGEVFEISAPPSLAGLSVDFSGENPTVTHHGMAVELSSVDIPLTSVIVAVVNSFSTVKSGEVSVSQTAQAILVDGRSLSGSFTLKLNVQEFTPIFLEIGQINLTATITVAK